MSNNSHSNNQNGQGPADFSGLDLSKLQAPVQHVAKTTNRAGSPETIANDGTVSVYEPAWKAIKAAGYNGLQINLNFAREEARLRRKLTKAEKDKLFARLRKALSHRKEVDLEYKAEFPTAKLQVLAKDYESGAVVVALRYEPLICSMSSLADLDTSAI